MSNLSNKACEACRAGVPLATPEEITTYMAQLPDWQITLIDGINRLEKVYSFNNFEQSLQSLLRN